MASRVLRGVGVSPGIVVGPARVLTWDLPTVTRSVVAARDVKKEVRRLHDAVAHVRKLLQDLRERTVERAGEEEAKIFDAQIMMLEDPDFLGDVEQLIRENQLSADRAFEFKTLELKALWGQSANYHLRQRVADLTGIQTRVLNTLLGMFYYLRVIRISLVSDPEETALATPLHLRTLAAALALLLLFLGLLPGGLLQLAETAVAGL